MKRGKMSVLSMPWLDNDGTMPYAHALVALPLGRYDTCLNGFSAVFSGDHTYT